MKLLTTSIRAKLIRNGRIRDTPDAACTWLLTEIDPHDEDITFGLCDLGMGFPELGSVRISELKSVRGKLGLPEYCRTPSGIVVIGSANRSTSAPS